MSLGNFFIGIIVFFIIVLIHEFGHFIIAKLSDVKVEEFAIGMGPKLIGSQRGETLYSIRAIPIGGFCRLTGEDGESNDSRAFNKKPIIIRIAVIIFGPLMNFFLAILIFSLVITQTTTINEVMEDKPAYEAGIAKGDKIIEIDGVKITTWDEVKPLISRSGGEPIEIVLNRHGNLKRMQIIPIEENLEEGPIIGIKPSLSVAGLSLGQGIKATVGTSVSMVDFLIKLFTGRASTDEVAGPIGIFVVVNEVAKFGFLYVLELMAILSLNLGIINLLPIPALDGGRLMFLFLELIRRKPMEAEKEGFIFFIGFVMLMFLALIIAYKDLIKLNLTKLIFK